MKVRSKINLGSLLHLRASFPENDLAEKYAGGEPPLRSELFSADQMEQHGKTLAGLHQLSPGQAPDQLLSRLAENEDVLIGVRDLLAEAVKANRRITPAGEWLLDNFYLIEEQIRTAKRHLPKGYSRELPRLLNGSTVGLPRVYDIALETISHGDGRVDPGSLSSFVAAYQTITGLTLGELWAIPIMLRLALIENLRRAATRIAAQRIDRNRADYWADQMMDIAEKDPKSVVLVIADMARSSPPMASAFVAEFARRLQGQSPALALPLTWIEQRLSESGLTIEQSVQSENQQQAVDQVSISNSIGSLRFLGAMDWRTFVETMSVVEQTLREDPAAAYGKMDFTTRDRYRHVVERMSRNSRLSECEVARHAIRLAQQGASGHEGDGRETHVGFYLIDKGVPQLERTAEVRLSTAEALQRTSGRFPSLIYVGTIVLMSLLFTGGLLAQAYAENVEGWVLALVCLLSLLCTSQLAVALVNWLATVLVMPHALPRMDFSEGIPQESRALVVVPTMLNSVENIDELTEALEVRFLANRDDHLHFGLLTDFRDAHEEILPEDEPLLRLAQKRIEELNEKYRETTRDAFFLFHRPRRWNPGERIWMGHERKRGKLADLNALLRGGAMGEPGDRFALVVGETAVLSTVQYVITLDTDTQLPRDTARQFVGAMAHPLNRARYDEAKQRVCEGYGILQPRVAVSLPGTNRSRYARLNGSDPGIDPYTRAISDVYQDLFGEGSFIGKGIYEVDAFERSLTGRFPENRILSHDLLEGCYARAGLLSDVQLYEEYPSCYSVDVSRRHRWIRGDWQLAGWLLPRVPGPDARRQKNPLSGLSRWKLFDNLRRSLVPSALTLMLLLGWTVLSPFWLWTLSVIGIILIPPLLAAILDLFQKPEDVLPEQHVAAALRTAGRHILQTVLTVAFLPYEAFFSVDAIVRTIWRMLVTQTRLLEWSPSSDPDRDRRTDLFAYCRTMWIGPVLATAAVMYLTLSDPRALDAALPILILWFASPAIAWWISQPIAPREAYLTDDQTIFLRKLARKTWAFFEKFVGPDDHWLPPDNYQEHPVSVVAHRTSPTNMGLALLANLSAYDFGYVSVGQLIERTSNALHTMKALERHRGHFYNWYDTQSLKPLLPTYVSTVDSGNLAGHLLTLRPGLLALPDQKILGPRFFDGLSDTLRVLEDAVGETTLAQLAHFQKHLESAFESRPTTLTAARLCLDRLATTAEEVLASLKAVPESQATWWASALARQCRDALDDLMFLAPWALLSASQNRLSECGDIDEIPTLRELARLDAACLPAIEHRVASEATHGKNTWVADLQQLVVKASQRARERIAAVEALARQASHFADMDYDFLFDKGCHLLAIGYNVGERRRDSSYYDL
ncbi:MAG: cyclic beta 1-2 glucan synthetase, partial [Nitrospirota bacterium]